MKCSKDKDVFYRVFGRPITPASMGTLGTIWVLRLPLEKASNCCLPVGRAHVLIVGSETK